MSQDKAATRDGGKGGRRTSGRRSAKRRLFPALAVLPLLAFGMSGPAHAQDSATSASTDVLGTAAESKLGFGKGSIIVAPIPLKDPTIGTGLVLTGGYLFKADEKSDTSFIGLAGLKTNNGSVGAGLAGHIYFDEGRWAILTAIGSADVNYNLYGNGNPGFKLPISQSGNFAKGKVSYGVTDHLTFGIQATYLETTIKYNGAPPFGLPSLPDIGIKSSEVLVGPEVEWDTRDDNVYPLHGIYGSATYLKGFGLERRKRDFTQWVTFGDAFTSLGDKTVLAAKVTACGASQDAPFYNLCGVGSTDGLRGFPTGEYLNANLLSAQVELRQRFTERWGGVVFAGLAGIGPNFGDLSSDGPIYAGGAGVRFRLSRKFPLDFRVDVTMNQAGQSYTYIGIGQAF